MEHISIFNYEAFYLDFLEGNLSEEDTVLLFEFLEKHPELKLEDDAFVTLNDDLPMLDEQFKMGLKQVELNETTITPNNAEQFMIAETEELLSSEKLQELDRFVGSDAERIKQRKLVAATKLKPDIRVVYADKDALKRTKRIALWPFISLAAAACAVVLFLLWDPADSALQNQGGHSVSQKDPLVQPTDNAQPTDSDASVAAPSINTVQVADVNTFETKDQLIPSSHGHLNRVPKLDLLVLKKATVLPEKGSDPEIIRTTWSQPKQVQVEEPKNDYTMLGFDDMTNPIKPITNRLSDVVKQEVDFRTAKPSEERSGGFYVKIGKFELSHKKHR